jgi:hypothetical protein
MLDDARRLAWGYVAYPPLTPWIGRLAFELFGPSLVGMRFFSSLAQCLVMVLAGLMARELGGKRFAQAVAAVAAGIAPISLIQGALFQYVSFDILWWVLAAYCTLRLLKSGNLRGWLAIGACIGLGMMTKYTMLYFAAGLAGGVIFTPARRWLSNRWLWAGAALSLLIFLPNLVWQAQHEFISIQFLTSIHARDVEIGRTQGFLLEQLIVLGWMYAIPFFLLLVTQGRSYYLAPAYPMLIAAGAAALEARLAGGTPQRVRRGQMQTWASLAAGSVMGAALMLPIAPVNSGWWKLVTEVHDNFAEQIGWPEIAAATAQVYNGLPQADRDRAGILTGNYGEAGAINLYGPAHGLPPAISAINSYWLLGPGEPPPETLVVLGYSLEEAAQAFQDCQHAATISAQHGVENEESLYHRAILVCRGPRLPWPELWRAMRRFG